MTYQTVALVGAVALAAGGAVGSVGSASRTSISGRASGEPVATNSSSVEIGGRQEAAGSVTRLFSAAERAAHAAVDAVNGLDQLSHLADGPHREIFTNYLRRMISDKNALYIADTYASQFLPNQGVRPAAEALQPQPASWTQLMGWMSDSHVQGKASPELRQAYDVALTKTIPNQLRALHQSYLRSVDAIGIDFDADMTRNPLVFLQAYEDARAMTNILAAKSEISADEIIDLAHRVTYARLGRRPLATDRGFTPIFSDSVLPASPDTYVDALTAARTLRFEGRPVFFPHEFSPPGAPVGRINEVEVAASISRSVTRFFNDADRHTTLPDLWPEGIRRRRFVDAVFPKLPFTAVDALDADQRAMATAFYARVLRPSAARRKYNFRGYYKIHEEITAAHLGSAELEDTFLDILGRPIRN